MATKRKAATLKKSNPDVGFTVVYVTVDSTVECQFFTEKADVEAFVRKLWFEFDMYEDDSNFAYEHVRVFKGNLNPIEVSTDRKFVLEN